MEEDINMLNEENHAKFLDICHRVAQWSPDPSTQVGAILVDLCGHIVSSGFNAFPREEEHDFKMYLNREYKYKHIRHAEVDCIRGFLGQTFHGLTLYTTHPPCENCAGFITGYGIKKVVSCIPSKDYESRWLESTDKASAIFEICQVEFVKYSLDK